MSVFDKLRQLDESIGGAVLRREGEVITDFHDDFPEEELGNTVISIESSKILREMIDSVLARCDDRRKGLGNNEENHKQWLVIRELCQTDEPLTDVIATLRFNDSVKTSYYYCLTLRNLRDSSVLMRTELVF